MWHQSVLCGLHHSPPREGFHRDVEPVRAFKADLQLHLLFVLQSGLGFLNENSIGRLNHRTAMTAERHHAGYIRQKNVFLVLHLKTKV